MPSALTYPGVYVEEIPSGVRTITGVATSITAFIGGARRGPTNKAVTINSFGDFETIFGGLWENSSLGFAVRDFFINGGGQAIVVRLYHTDPGNPNGNPPVATPDESYKFSIGQLSFVSGPRAADPKSPNYADKGKWGVGLRASVDQKGITDEVAKSLGAGITKADVFNLTVIDTATGKSEKFTNLTVKDSPRRVDKVLESSSALIAYDNFDPKAPPTAPTKEESDPLSALEKTWSDAKKKVVEKQNSGPKPDITAEKKAVDDAKKALDDELTKALAKVSDGLALTVNDFLPKDGETNKQGLYALAQADLFNILCIPPYHAPTDPLDFDVNLVSAAAAYCEKRRAMLVVDPPKDWTDKSKAVTGFNNDPDEVGTRSRNAALYFPRLRQPNPLHDNQMETFAPCGAVAGIFARTDAQRGVWKAPAGLDAALVGVPSLSVSLTDNENGELNPLGVNCLRSFQAAGRVVWGARTLRGSDQLADEYKYVPVRRTALYIEESLYRGLKWVVFEPNDEPLWAQIRLNVGAFMHNLFRQGAFQGTSPRDAYFVKCDKETTTQNDINLGIVNIVVGFAPLKPAEFVVIKLQQIAGQIEV
jgi:phage tail sheath protein FI